MPISINQYAEACAAMHLCVTPALAAEALRCSPDTASVALRDAVSAGLFRRLLLSGLGNTPVYQPTAKAAGVDAKLAPKFFRAGIDETQRWRGLLRAGLIAQDHHVHTFLTVENARAQCEIHAIPMRGYDEPLLSHDAAGLHHAHVCIAPQAALKSSPGLIERAILRWSPWLQDGGLELYFVTLAGRPADALQAALSEYQPPSSGAARELAELEAHIATDRTGAARIQFASRRAELAAAAELEPATVFPWLQTSVTQVRV
ncbi:hypothetical protein NUJ28_15040 [Burkholderia multivorans]|uniref:hypothetical protein n=1 Tax=Burkholderia multivorans TaxID=87883 RepID=UPI0021DB3B64|nr:hypothetical protein [Burkholderia multivorans]UXZ60796.1 hypothetical protein NUJ28_15040 [Burkholderia multivorans]